MLAQVIPFPGWAAPLLRLVRPVLAEGNASLDPMVRWRARITAVLLVAAVTLGLVRTIPLLALSLQQGAYGRALLDGTAVLVAGLMLLSPRVSNGHRQWFLTVACFAMGASVLVGLGPYPSAFGWLFASSLVAAALLGARAAGVVFVSVLLFVGATGLALLTGALSWPSSPPKEVAVWMLMAADFVVLLAVFTCGTGLTLRLLASEIRARQTAEGQLAEARRHEALGTLASGIAHDFNNLLVPIMVNVELVHEALPPSESRTALADALASADRARDLVRRILGFTRKSDPERGALDLGQAAEEALRVLAAGRDVRSVALTRGEAPPVWASPGDLHSIVHNLVENAMNATADGGDVRVEVKSARGGVRLRVEDDGPGMDERTLQRIFDPYFSTRPRGRGTGLGLPIVQSLVRTLGGEVTVESTPGKGARFEVWLPACVLDGEVPVPSEPVPDLDGFEVLLVEDEPLVRRAVAQALRAAGARVTEMDTAEAALRAVEEAPGRFQLVVSDHRMGGMSGVELASALTARHPSIAVLVLSGDLDSTALPAGVQKLEKPFSPAQLVRRVADALVTAEPAPPQPPGGAR